MGKILTLLVFAGLVFAQTVGIQLSLGLTWDQPTDLRVVQQGYPDTTVKNAQFVGRDLEWFPYYSVRVWYGSQVGWRYELELIHQKIFFDRAEENGDIFNQFRVTDGFNYLFFNVAYAFGAGVRIVPRVGLGIIVPHPETTVRGKEWGIDGDARYYHFGGFGAQVAVGLEAPWVVGPKAEGKFTLAYSRLNIADGFAEGWFKTFHATFGLGYP